MLDQHVAVTIGEDVCNLPDLYGMRRPSRTDLGSIFGGVLGGKKTKQPRDIASELRTFGGR